MESRSFCADLVEVAWTEDNRRHHRVANLEDISPTGICLMLEISLPVGREVSVRMEGRDLGGVIRHSTQGEAGFLLGIEFDAGSGWSSDFYRPRHLLDPEDLFPQIIFPRHGR